MTDNISFAQLDKLEAAAKAASPGPYQICDGAHGTPEDQWPFCDRLAIFNADILVGELGLTGHQVIATDPPASQMGPEALAQAQADVRYFALLAPATVQELVRVYRATAGRYTLGLAAIDENIPAIQRAIDDLKASKRDLWDPEEFQDLAERFTAVENSYTLPYELVDAIKNFDDNMENLVFEVDRLEILDELETLLRDLTNSQNRMSL